MFRYLSNRLPPFRVALSTPVEVCVSPTVFHRPNLQTSGQFPLRLTTAFSEVDSTLIPAARLLGHPQNGTRGTLGYVQTFLQELVQAPGDWADFLQRTVLPSSWLLARAHYFLQKLNRHPHILGKVDSLLRREALPEYFKLLRQPQEVDPDAPEDCSGFSSVELACSWLAELKSSGDKYRPDLEAQYDVYGAEEFFGRLYPWVLDAFIPVFVEEVRVVSGLEPSKDPGELHHRYKRAVQECTLVDLLAFLVVFGGILQVAAHAYNRAMWEGLKVKFQEVLATLGLVEAVTPACSADALEAFDAYSEVDDLCTRDAFNLEVKPEAKGIAAIALGFRVFLCQKEPLQYVSRLLTEMFSSKYTRKLLKHVQDHKILTAVDLAKLHASAAELNAFIIPSKPLTRHGRATAAKSGEMREGILRVTAAYARTFRYSLKYFSGRGGDAERALISPEVYLLNDYYALERYSDTLREQTNTAPSGGDSYWEYGVAHLLDGKLSNVFRVEGDITVFSTAHYLRWRIHVSPVERLLGCKLEEHVEFLRYKCKHALGYAVQNYTELSQTTLDMLYKQYTNPENVEGLDAYLAYTATLAEMYCKLYVDYLNSTLECAGQERREQVGAAVGMYALAHAYEYAAYGAEATFQDPTPPPWIPGGELQDVSVPEGDPAFAPTREVCMEEEGVVGPSPRGKRPLLAYIPIPRAGAPGHVFLLVGSQASRVYVSISGLSSNVLMDIYRSCYFGKPLAARNTRTYAGYPYEFLAISCALDPLVDLWRLSNRLDVKVLYNVLRDLDSAADLGGMMRRMRAIGLIPDCISRHRGVVGGKEAYSVYAGSLPLELRKILKGVHAASPTAQKRKPKLLHVTRSVATLSASVATAFIPRGGFVLEVPGTTRAMLYAKPYTPAARSKSERFFTPEQERFIKENIRPNIPREDIAAVCRSFNCTRKELTAKAMDITYEAINRGSWNLRSLPWLDPRLEEPFVSKLRSNIQESVRRLDPDVSDTDLELTVAGHTVYPVIIPVSIIPALRTFESSRTIKEDIVEAASTDSEQKVCREV